MAKSNVVEAEPIVKKRAESPEQFASYKEAGKFWDNHSLADYNDVVEDVEFDTSQARRSMHIRLADDSAMQLRHVARGRDISAEALLNLWVQEKLATLNSTPATTV